MKPYLHAKSSVKKWAGKIEDYLPIHDFMDSSKAVHASVKHRVVLHSAFGIYLAERVFGHNIKTSDNKEVSVRDIAEQHVIEDLGTIPSLDDWLDAMELQPWMGGPSKEKKIINLKD